MAGLEHDLLEMGARAERMVGQAVDSLCRLDVSLAQETLRSDDEIDALEKSLEERCIRLLALQQPMGTDLRTIGSILKIVTDIERIADLAVDLAKITLKVEREFGEVSFLDLARISNEARSMFRRSLDAYVRGEISLICEICLQDEVVDQLYRELRAEIFEDMRNRPDQVVVDGWLLLAIHHMERIGDHAVNICERVYYTLTGEFLPKEWKQP